MATLNVIYKIAADISGLQTGVNRAATSMESLESKATVLGRAISGAFVATAVIGFAKDILDAADSLTKLSDQTGIGTEALQRLDLVAQDSGNTLEQVATGVNKLQKNIQTGGKAIVSTLDELGIQIADIKALSPDQQFYAIAKAIQTIKDPAEQTRVAMELFGKAGAALLPTLKADVDAMKDVPVASAESIAALDRFGDSLGRLWKVSKGFAIGFAGNLLMLGEAWERFKMNIMSGGALEQRLQQMGAFAKAMDPKNAPPSAGIAPIPSSPIGADEAIALLNGGLKEQVEQVKANEEAWRKDQQALERFLESARNVLAFTDGFGTSLDTVDGAVLEGIRYYVERGKSLSDLGRFYGLTTQQVEALNEQFKFERSVVDATTKSFGGFAQQMQIALPSVKGITEEMTYLDSTVLPSVNLALPEITTGITNLTKAERAAIQPARTLADSLKSLAHLDFKQVTKDLGNFLKNGLGSIGKGFLEGIGQGILGGISALLGKGVSALWSGIKSLFGSNAEKEINPIRQAFINASGGLDILNQRAHEAGVTLKAVLDAKNPEAYKKAIDDLNAALEFQDQAMQTLDETVKKYGFSLEELGPALQRANLDKQAATLYQDFKVLTSAGISVDTVLGRMGDSINEFVHNALKTGTEVPAAMAPMLQRMVELGTLTDENGNVITDLEASGIHFAETMTQGFQKIVDAVQKLTDAISRGLGLAIQNIPSPVITGKVQWDVDSIPTPDASDYRPDVRIPALADGGIVNRPTVALIGESGPEMVTPLGKAGGAGVQVGSISVNVYAAHGDNPQQLGDKIIEAMRAYTPLYDAVGEVSRRRAA